jgi:3,4-dihydroxy 2-butanone 4-phosphate synthase/GTP cyclohydrolase II
VANRFSSVDEAVAALGRGEVIIVVDDEDRENEGDFICAAEKVSPEIVNFMITHGRGQVCMPVLPDICERLRLDPIVDVNTSPTETPYTIPVDHRSVRTGIEAQERARTIQAIVDPHSKPSDFVRPGHLYPLKAKEGGVLRRAGHTEATVDLVRLTGMTPAGVLCEILDERGNRANRDELFAIAERFGLVITSIEELIRYRRIREKLVYRQAEAVLPTKYGEFRLIAYGVKHESQEPIVLVMGDVAKVEAPLVRLHS